jgi:arylsulfatase A-like enzyme
MMTIGLREAAARWSWLVPVLSLANSLGAAASERPNIIFILADDLGWKDVGFMGAEFFETPHIDRLAATGMTFTAASTSGPNCSPTRASLMTGCYPPRHRIYTPGGKAKGDPAFMRLLVPVSGRTDRALERQAERAFPITNVLDSSFVCIPEVLAQAGYVSARIGKWHLGPDPQGFDLRSADGRDGPDEDHYGDPMVAERLTDRALAFIDEHRERPFFLYLAHWDVHSPYRALGPVLERYRQKLAALPPDGRQNFDPVYAAMIHAVDTSVGRIVAKVAEVGLAERTLLIFTSDNGGLRRVSQLDPLRGEKGSLFEAGVRVPACASWPGRISPGSRCETPITSVDFMPTFAALAGADLPREQPVDGVDLTPLLRGDTIPERSLFWHYPLYLAGEGLAIEVPGGRHYSWRGFPATSIRRGRWKLIEFLETDTAALYDLEIDPGERQDLSAERPELAAELRAALDAWQQATKAPVPTTRNPECVLPPP